MNESDQELGEGRIRKKGGGRKKDSEKYPDLLDDISEMISAHSMGDPSRPLIWSSKSVRKVSKSLQEKGYQISHETVRKTMMGMGYSLQSNKKTREGGDHPDRDVQFEHINTLSKEFLISGDPVISVDCKKKELIGNYKKSDRKYHYRSECI